MNIMKGVMLGLSTLALTYALSEMKISWQLASIVLTGGTVLVVLLLLLLLALWSQLAQYLYKRQLDKRIKELKFPPRILKQ